MTKLLLLAFASLLTSHCSSGQTRYAVHFINFRDEVNSSFNKQNSDGLCTILVDGYLNGKLKAYKLSSLNAPIRASESQKANYPRKWNGNINGEVLLDEPFDAVMNDESRLPGVKSNKQSLNWQQPVFFLPPAETDTLSKKEFLDQMVIEEFELDSSRLWDKRRHYESGEVVYYGTNNYSALLDTVGIAPTNKLCWELWSYGNLPLYHRLDDLNGISIIGYYETNGRDSTWHPQLIRLRKSGVWKGILEDMNVTFLYTDALRYLNSFSQPVLNNNSFGYVGNNLFVFGSSWPNREETNLSDLIKKKLVSKRLPRSKVIVENVGLYRKFLKEGNNAWNLFQHVATKDIHIFKNDILALTIPAASIELLIGQKPKSKLFTYYHVLSENMFFGWVGKLPAALTQSNTPVTEGWERIATTHEYSYLQKYYLETSKSQQDSLLFFLNPLWQLITREFYKNKLKLSREKKSMYPGKFDWSKIESIRAKARDIRGEFWVNLLHDEISNRNYPYSSSYAVYLHDSLQSVNPDSIQFSITYEINLNSDLTNSNFEVSQISFKDKARYEDIEYTFNWSDIKQILIGENIAGLNYFMSRIEKGEVKFLKSEIVYGLHETKKSK